MTTGHPITDTAIGLAITAALFAVAWWRLGKIDCRNVSCRAYRAFATNPSSVGNRSSRMALLRHPVECRECLRWALTTPDYTEGESDE